MVPPRLVLYASYVPNMRLHEPLHRKRKARVGVMQHRHLKWSRIGRVSATLICDDGANSRTSPFFEHRVPPYVKHLFALHQSAQISEACVDHFLRRAAMSLRCSR